MNHLRDFLDCIDGGTYPSIGPDSESADFDRYIREAQNAICFFGGDGEGISKLQAIDDLAVLPFDVCWFEFFGIDNGNQVTIGIVAIKNADGFDLCAFHKRGGRWYYVCEVQSLVTPGKILLYQGWPELGVGFHTNQSYLVRAFLSAMNCTNVARTEHRQPDKLQKARTKRGKKSLFSYWTLELTRDRAEGTQLGGTHSSPRLHLRRGHPRQYAPNKWTWVQPCAVGNKALGMVHKDYRLDGLPHNAELRGRPLADGPA